MIQDNFNVGNHTDLDGQASSDGDWVWEKVEGSGVALMRTDSTTDCQAAIGFGERCFYRAEKDLSSEDQYVQATISVPTNDLMYPGLVVRKDSSATLTYYDVSIRMDSDVLRIRKRVAGTFTTLQDNAFTFALATTYLIRFEVEGTTLRTFVNGTQIGADLMDSSIASGLRVGMTAEIGGSLTKFGNFEDFEASEMTPTFRGTFRESGRARERIAYDLSPVLVGTVRERAGASDRIAYSLSSTITAVVRETAMALDRIVGTNAGTMTAVVREAATATDRDTTGRNRISGLTQAPTGPSMAILTHIYDFFGSGLDWAFSDVRRAAPAHAHAGRVLTWGTSTREIPIPAGPPRLGRLTIEFDDTPDPVTGVQFFRSQFGARTPKGKRVDLKLGPADGSEALFQIPAAGVIEHATFPPGKMRLEIPDVRYKWLQKPMPGLINDENFPNLPPGVKDGFSKWVLGSVTSQGLGAQGALPCIHVDTVLHQYDLARHRIVDATIYTKTPTETEFAFTPFSYSIVELPKTIKGLPYTFSFVQFDSALPEGTEVRADIRGLPGSGGWGTVPPGPADSESENVIDHAVSIAYYVDSLEKGRLRTLAEAFETWDLVSMATVRQQIIDRGWEVSAYAITEPLTPEVILTQLFSTFMIHWFPSRLDKTKVVMTTVDTPADAPIFGDFHSILRESETQELAQDTRNRIVYNFAKIHEGTGRFAGHGVYDNEADQTELTDSNGEPIIEVEEIDLHACRDEDVALEIAVEWSTWRDQQAHRVQFSLDLPTKMSQADLARDFLLTNYGGLKSGGWVRERFFPYRVHDDYDNLRITLTAIRKPNASIIIPETQVDGQFRKNSRISLSYVTGNKRLFNVLADARVGFTKMVLMVTDDDGILVPADDGVFPTLANPIESFDSIRSGNFIHVWTQERNSGRVAYHVADLAQQEWDTLNDEILASNSDGDVGVTGCIRSNGEAVCAFMGDRQAAGPCVYGGMEVAPAGDYERAYVSRLVSGTWTAPDMLASPGTLSATFFPFGLDYAGAVSVRIGRAMAEADDWVRFACGIVEPADVASSQDIYTQLLRPDNTLTTAWEFKFTGGLGISPECCIGDPCVFEYLGTQYTAVPVGLVYFPTVYIWEGTGTPGSATFEVPLVDSTTGIQIQPDTYSTLNPTISLRWFKDKIQVVMGTRIGSTDEWAALKTISPPFEAVSPDPLDFPRDQQVGPTWPNGTYARHAVEFATILGRDILFKVTSGNFGLPDNTAYSILERIDLGTDVPEDNSYTLAQWLIDNA